MSEKKVRLGLIGLGYRAGGLARIYHHLIFNSTVVAVCDRIEALAHKTKEILEDLDIAIYTGHRRMLKKFLIDAVSTFVVPEHNPDIVCECLEAGRPGKVY
ncbi:MAG: Gfo/Idh/MocA family oxidoreductase [Candidatus Ratteibacteria bacterium]